MMTAVGLRAYGLIDKKATFTALNMNYEMPYADDCPLTIVGASYCRAIGVAAYNVCNKNT